MGRKKAFVAGALVVGGLLALAAGARLIERGEAKAESHQASPASPLAFTELFDPAGPTLRPSARAASLVGKRVRMVGFMAQMEAPPAGAFYLTPRPVHCDEAGGGTGDLPPESVRVAMRSAKGGAVPFMAGALEAVGTLEVGNEADEDGRVSAFRLHLDQAVETPNEDGKRSSR